MTIFSFHPVKAIAAGEGGMITTNDEATYRKLIRLRSHGINKLDDQLLAIDQANTNGAINPWYYEMQELGFHYRITDIQSALAFSQLKKLDTFVSRRRDLASQYDKLFKEISQFKPIQIMGRLQSAHHLYVLRINFDAIKLNKSKLMSHLKSQGIGSQVHYIPVARHPYYRTLGFLPESYPNAESYYKEALTIPLFYDLTNDQQHKIFDIFQEVLN
jgi:dTDP-4-amino-4,6-dideoxygalactose transaminase